MVSSIQYINGFSMFAMVPESGVLDFTSDTKCFLIAVTDDKAGEYVADASTTSVQEGSPCLSPTHPVLKQGPDPCLHSLSSTIPVTAELASIGGKEE